MNPKTWMVSIAAVAMLLTLTVLPARADSLTVTDLTPQVANAGLDIAGLTVMEVGGIVVIRGTATDPAQAQQAGVLLQKLGYNRVANLVQIITAPDDAAIERTAERRLAMSASLEGCNLRVDSKRGVVTVAGQIHSDFQRQIAAELLRDIDGVSQVKTDLRR